LSLQIICRVQRSAIGERKRCRVLCQQNKKTRLSLILKKTLRHGPNRGPPAATRFVLPAKGKERLVAATVAAAAVAF
jgi:hypothetical protein